MAWSVVSTPHTLGNKRAYTLLINTDGAEANVDTGLSYIEGFVLGESSMTTGPQWIAANSNSTGLASPGYLGCSGFTSGDKFYVLVYGR